MNNLLYKAYLVLNLWLWVIVLLLEKFVPTRRAETQSLLLASKAPPLASTADTARGVFFLIRFRCDRYLTSNKSKTAL